MRMDKFEEYLRNTNLSENTIISYTFAVRQYFAQFETVNKKNLRVHKTWLIESYTPKTVNLRIRAINCYLDSIGKESLKLQFVKVQQKAFLENVISPADYEYLKNCLLRDGKFTYYYAIRFMAATGVRVSELVRFQVEDVRRGYIDLHSKGNRTRRVFIPKNIRTPCLEWLESINRTTGDVFLNRFGKRISPGGIRDQLKKYACIYNLDPSVVYPHSFRHLFAKNFIERCNDIAMLSDILGHDNIETTRIYLHRSSSEQKQMFNTIVDW